MEARIGVEGGLALGAEVMVEVGLEVGFEAFVAEVDAAVTFKVVLEMGLNVVARPESALG